MEKATLFTLWELRNVAPWDCDVVSHILNMSRISLGSK